MSLKDMGHAAAPARLVAATALLGLAATACATTSSAGAGGGNGAAPTSPPASSPATADPARLVGSWHVRADGEPDGAILTIGDRVDGGLLLFRPCGMLSGSWRANRLGMFVGAIDGGDGSCYGADTSSPHDPSPRWLPDVRGFRVQGDRAVLLSATGDVVATLEPGARPTTGPNDSPQFASPPVVTPAMRASWAQPAPLPAGVVAAGTSAVLGRWRPVADAGSRAYVAFGRDGRYRGSDGCNGVGGRYLLGVGGVVLATSGPSTAIGCENSPLPSWVAQSGRLGMRAGHLVFVDPHGAVLGEARRA